MKVVLFTVPSDILTGKAAPKIVKIFLGFRCVKLEDPEENISKLFGKVNSRGKFTILLKKTVK